MDQLTEDHCLHCRCHECTMPELDDNKFPLPTAPIWTGDSGDIVIVTPEMTAGTRAILENDFEAHIVNVPEKKEEEKPQIYEMSKTQTYEMCLLSPRGQSSPGSSYQDALMSPKSVPAMSPRNARVPLMTIN